MLGKISRSREGAWIEIDNGVGAGVTNSSRSREGAWIEIKPASLASPTPPSRSREGAWIEIKQWAIRCVHEAVAPVRERGLK